MSPAPPETKARPSPAVVARVGAMAALLALAAAPLASALAGPNASVLVQAWRALREAAATGFGLQIHAPAAVDAGFAVVLALLAAACDGYPRGGVSMMRGLAQGWRKVNKVSAPRTGPTRPVEGFAQAALAQAYFLVGAAVGAVVASQAVALLLTLVIATVHPDFNPRDYLVLSGGLWLVFALIGLRWTPISLIGGVILFPLYALLALAVRGWRVLLVAGLAAMAAAAFIAFAR